MANLIYNIKSLIFSTGQAMARARQDQYHERGVGRYRLPIDSNALEGQIHQGQTARGCFNAASRSSIEWGIRQNYRVRPSDETFLTKEWPSPATCIALDLWHFLVSGWQQDAWGSESIHAAVQLSQQKRPI
jgi:hypothetical protein